MDKTSKIYLHDLGIICALGANKKDISDRVFNAFPNGLTITADCSPGRELPLGQVNSVLPSVAHLPQHEQTRCNQLLLAALEQIQPTLDVHLGKTEKLKIGVVIGTSTSGIREGERAMSQWWTTKSWPRGFSYQQQEMSAPAQCLARWLDARGPAQVISTACSSSAKALASGRRWLRAGICDVVIAGGVDSLCRLTVEGFSALESVSDTVCNPFSNNRNGINIGEGAAVFVMSRDIGPVVLSGVGENSDAHHISAPVPGGAGAKTAMAMALSDASISPGQINYLNLHGTATRQNDKMESSAVAAVLGNSVACSSTKAYTGHTLGAAGAIEAGICWLGLTQDQDHGGNLPVQLWDGITDPELEPLDFVSEPRKVDVLKYAMSNSFAFGGNNISLILERN